MKTRMHITGYSLLTAAAIAIAAQTAGAQTQMAQPQIRGRAEQKAGALRPADGTETLSLDESALRDEVNRKMSFEFQRLEQTNDGVIVPPASERGYFREGTEKSFSRFQLAQLYARQDPRDAIHSVLQRINTLSSKPARVELKAAILKIVGTSIGTTPKPAEERCPPTERLMCFVLNRGYEMADIIDSYSDRRQPGVLDQEIRVMAESLRLAAEYYKDIFDFLGPIATDGQPVREASEVYKPDYAKFGTRFAETFMKMNEAVLQARAQYNTAFTILAYFQYDLVGRDPYSNINRRAAATIYDALSRLPKPDEEDRTTPRQKIQNLRALWTAYIRAKEILASAPQGVRLMQQRRSADAPAATTYSAGQSVYLLVTYQGVTIERADANAGSLLVYTGSGAARQFSTVSSAQVVPTVPANGYFKTGVEVSDSELESTGTVEATLDNGVIVVNWSGPAASSKQRGTTSAFLWARTENDGRLREGASVWIESRQTFGRLHRLYRNAAAHDGAAIVDLGTQGTWRGSTKDLKPY
ncbi:MAG TPA: hypothetical protein VM598_13760 [Bdellovibrionota bacterium]|nr:hypothetical protein [Bdellovibrionota bacterium]